MSLADDMKKKAQEVLKDPAKLKEIQDMARQKGISFNDARTEYLSKK